MSKKRIKFFNQVFHKNRTEEYPFRLGKYSDRNKSVEQLNAWTNSLELFEKNNYLEAIENFFEFLKDPKVENLTYVKKNDKIEFYFYQGSKQIKGIANAETICVFSDIVIFEKLDNSFAERLLSLNYNLKFCKFSVKENKIICELTLYSQMCNPTTLYYALRELAITADRYDDLLFMLYRNITPVNVSHIKQLPEKELGVKLKYFKKWTKELLNNLSNLDALKYANGRSFLMIGYLYKIYYLLSPEGELLEIIRGVVNDFHNPEVASDLERNAKVYKKIVKLSEYSDERLAKSLYSVYAVFPTVPPSEPQKIINFINKEVGKIDWYEDNNHLEIALSVTDYIIGYSSYHFDNEPVMVELYNVYWEVMYSDFFKEMGAKHLSVEKERIIYYILNNKFNSINLVAKKYYKKFNFNIKHLNIANELQFAVSFIYELINLNFEKSDDEVED